MAQVPPRSDEQFMEERRAVPRHAFGVVQQVAEVAGDAPLSAGQFSRVQIVDLSRDGFAYLTLSKPTGDEVVVIMGDPPDLDCLTGRIVYARTMEEFGHTFYRIGCQFTGKPQLNVQSVLSGQRCDTETMLRELSRLSNVENLSSD